MSVPSAVADGCVKFVRFTHSLPRTVPTQRMVQTQMRRIEITSGSLTTN